MRPDQQRVQTLLTDTVTLLCKNGLQYSKELKVQGLLGITLDDDDVFIVHINKIFDEVRGKVSSVSAEPNQGGAAMKNMNAIAGLNSFGQFESVDGVEFEEEEEEEPMSNGMQLPVIHAQKTSILNRTATTVKNATNRGVKRPVGAARRKEPRSVKQRLAASFSPEEEQEIHHIQMNKDSGYNPEYQEVHVKDEPPDQVIITDTGLIRVDDNLPTLEKVSQGSTYNSTGGRDSYAKPGQNSMVMYESLEDCDESSSPDNKVKDTEEEDAMDMIECLLYKEGVDKSEENNKPTSGMYKTVHISGADGADSPLDGSMMGNDDTLASCSGWEESIEVHNLSTAGGGSMTTSKTSRKASPQAEDTITYSGITRQDINEVLSAQYRDLLEAAAVQGDGYPCAECDQVLKTRAIWMEHMKGVHMNRKYACPHCGETFKWRSSRKRHVLITHRNEKDIDLGSGMDMSGLDMSVT